MPSCPPDSFLVANLTPEATGLPFVVWLSQSGDSGHAVRIWISRGPKPTASEMVAVAIRPDIRVADGELSATDLALLQRWMELNLKVLVGYCDGDIEFTEVAIQAIRPIEPT